MNTALKKINARVKVLQKKHPGKKRVTLQKQAGKEYRAGKLKPHRKKTATVKKKKRRAKPRSLGTKYKVSHRVKKVGKTKRKRTRKAAPKVWTVTRRRTRVVVRRRRVGGMGKGTLMTVVAVAAVVGIGYLLLKKSTPPTVTVPGVNASLNLTGNAVRDTAAQNLLAYAQAANLGASALASLINSINSMGDATVVSSQEQVQSGMNINTLLALPTGGPSINLG